jgi:hypothetical protein
VRLIKEQIAELWISGAPALTPWLRESYI